VVVVVVHVVESDCMLDAVVVTALCICLWLHPICGRIGCGDGSKSSRCSGWCCGSDGV
jgi:hypothetical protein